MAQPSEATTFNVSEGVHSTVEKIDMSQNMSQDNPGETEVGGETPRAHMKLLIQPEVRERLPGRDHAKTPTGDNRVQGGRG